MSISMPQPTHSDTCELLTVVEATDYLAISRGAVHKLLDTTLLASTTADGSR